MPKLMFQIFIMCRKTSTHLCPCSSPKGWAALPAGTAWVTPAKPQEQPPPGKRCPSPLMRVTRVRAGGTALPCATKASPSSHKSCLNWFWLGRLMEKGFSSACLGIALWAVQLFWRCSALVDSHSFLYYGVDIGLFIDTYRKGLMCQT